MDERYLLYYIWYLLSYLAFCLNEKRDILNDQQLSAELWRQFKAGDPDALGEIGDIHYRALYNYGTKFTRDSEFIRDCIQDLYLNLWEKRAFISETAFVKSYLFKSLRHRILRESVRQNRFERTDELSFDPVGGDESVESLIIENEHSVRQIKHLEGIISGLTKRQQEVVYLRYYQGLSNEDIAQVMGLGRQSVSNLLSKTLKEIKDQWLLALVIILSFSNKYFS